MFKAFHNPRPNPSGISNVLQRDSVFFHTGDVEGVGDGTGGDNERVKGELEGVVG
jgi:hypothetical protein